MKRSFVLLSCALVLGGCTTIKSWWQPKEVERTAPVAVHKAPPGLNIDGTPIETVEFVPGVSSFTVEKMAKAAGCASSGGAGRVSNKGPIEVYKMQCDDGKVYLARCELRQCKPMK